MKPIIIITAAFLLFNLSAATAGHLGEDIFCGDGVLADAEAEVCRRDDPEKFVCIENKIEYAIGERCRNLFGIEGICSSILECAPVLLQYDSHISSINISSSVVKQGEPVTVTIYDPGSSVRITDRAFLKRVRSDGSKEYLMNFCGGYCSGSSIGKEQEWEGIAQPSGFERQTLELRSIGKQVLFTGSKGSRFEEGENAFMHEGEIRILEPGAYTVEFIDIFGARKESEEFFVSGEVIEGTVEDGHGLPVPDLTVILTQTEDLSFTTYTDEEGRYRFPADEAILDHSNKVVLTFVFAGKPASNGAERYFITDAKNGADLPVEAGTKKIFIKEIPERFDLVSNADLIDPDSVSAHSIDALDDIARMHISFAKAVRFADERLFTPVYGVNPLIIRAFAGESISYYRIGENSINLVERRGQTLWDFAGRPDVDFHEFGHALMNASEIGGRNKYPHPHYEGGNEFSHLGYANPSTHDSWTEGFATWFSAALQKELDYVPDAAVDEPRLFWYGNGAAIDMEDHIKAWDNMGRDEDLAAAALLWDIYDSSDTYDGNPDDDGIRISGDDPMTFVWSLLNQENIRDMKDAYDALRFSQSLDKRALDEIFIAHGFFADENGDMRYDEGEEVGRSAYGEVFTSSFDLNDNNAIDIWDVNTTIGRSINLNADEVGKWGAVDSEGERECGGLGDLDGDGKAEVDEKAFCIYPHLNRRVRPEFPEQKLRILLTDITGAQLGRAELNFSVEYEAPNEWRNYDFKVSVENGEEFAIWVPERAVAVLRARAGEDIFSEPLRIEGAEYRSRLVPGGSQGEQTFILPATANEIRKAFTESVQNAGDGGFSALLLIIPALIGLAIGFYFMINRRRKNSVSK